MAMLKALIYITIFDFTEARLLQLKNELLVLVLIKSLTVWSPQDSCAG